MKYSLVLVAAALLATPVAAQTTPPAISVTGEANLSVTPDQAQIDAGVTSNAKNAREASEANNSVMSKVLLALKGAGIEEKDYQTSQLSLRPQYAQTQPNQASQPVIAGYVASNRVLIRVRDMTRISGVIDALVAAGANNIGNINFMVSQASKLLDDAREQAIADARRKAEIYAKAANITLGAPLSISELGSPSPRTQTFHFGGGKTFGGVAAPTPIAQGEETLSVTVSVSWAIKPKE